MREWGVTYMNKVLKTVFRMALAMLAVGMVIRCAGVYMAYAAEPGRKGGFHKEYVVAQDGSGDFTTIQDAVDNVHDGDTLIIRPGVYVESVQVLDKELHIKGSGRDECMLLYDTVSYMYAPLEIAAGSVSDMTIWGVHVREREPSGVAFTEEELVRMVARYGEELAEYNIEKYEKYMAYAVHADSDFSYGRKLQFVNCRIVSENGACVGMGSRGGEEIVFRNCELLSRTKLPCIFLHDSALPDLGGETRFVLDDCFLQKNSSGDIARFDCMGDFNNFTFVFTNVTADIPGDLSERKLFQINNCAGDSANGWCGLHNTRLSRESSGNSIDAMNWSADRVSAYE